ncbi:MAG: transglycosylase domain-containing protein [Pseudonocardiaceae bacterium]
MSDQRGDNGWRLGDPGEGRPPQRPGRETPRVSPAYRPEAGPPYGGPPYTGPPPRRRPPQGPPPAGPPFPGPPPPGQPPPGPRRQGPPPGWAGRPPERHPGPRSPQQEPELLTHAVPAGHYLADDTGHHRAGHGRPRRRRNIRKIVLVGVLLALLGPVLAFLGGWLLLDVPSPAALAAERKQVTTIMASNGTTELGRYVPEEGNRIEVSLQDVPEHVENAVLAAEDRSFRSNPGFDVVGIGRAAWNQLSGGTGGGSTVTQQYVKVVTGDDDYSLIRKFREVVIAAKMTKQNSKDQILENYLNTIYFGRGAYGIQAASQAYFGKKVQELTASEAAVLAGAIQAPSKWDPAKNLSEAQFRWNFVLDGMVAQGWLSSAERTAAQYPETIPPAQVAGSPTDDRAHIVERVLSELEEHGISRDQLAVDGGRITTTIDPRAQELARDAVLAKLEGQPANLHSALVAIEPSTGAVLAYYGGQDGTGFDLAGGPAWNPGSSFKPFAMLAALEENIGINSIYDGDSPLTIDGIEYANSESRDVNALTLRDAMKQSVNTTFVQLTDEVGPRAVREAAIQAGIPAQINGEEAMVEPGGGTPGVGIALGQYPVHTIDMASAYATFAAEGMRRAPFFVSEYTDARDNINYTHVDRPERAFDARNSERNAQLARNVTATMVEVAGASQIPLDGSREVAAKTGTHQRGDTGSNSAAWTVGYTPSISTAVWVGDPANSAIKDRGGNDIFGRGLPGAIWQRFMNSYLKGTPKETFPPVKLIVGKTAGPAAAQVPPPPSEQRENREPARTPQPTRTIEIQPRPTPELDRPTAPPFRDRCFPFRCDDEPTEDPEEPGEPAPRRPSTGPTDGTGDDEREGP